MISPVGLRPMRLSDLDAVKALEAQAYSHAWSRGNFADSLASGYLAELLSVADGQLLGYFVVMPGVDELHLLNVTVAPEHQSRGLGSQLMQAVFEHGARLGMSLLWLEVRKSNLRAQSLYRRLGFAEVAVRAAYYPAGPQREDAVVMRRPLGRATAVAALAEPDAEWALASTEPASLSRLP